MYENTPYSFHEIILHTIITGSGFYIALGGGSAQYGYSHIMDVIQDKKFNCKLIDHTDDMAMISIQGPKRYRVLCSLSTLALLP